MLFYIACQFPKSIKKKRRKDKNQERPQLHGKLTKGNTIKKKTPDKMKRYQ